MQQSLASIYFHKDVSIPSTGLEYNVGKSSSLNIEFETTGAFSATIEAKINPSSTIWKPVMCADLATLDLNTTINNANHIYQIDVTGVSMIRINLTSVSSEISVYGRVVG